MESALISIGIAAIVYFIAIILRVFSAPKCAKCGGIGYWQHARKDGGPDRRYRSNSVVCPICSKEKNNLTNKSKSSPNIYLDIASKFSEGDWVVYESKKNPIVKALFRVYRDENQRLQPFKNLDNFDLNEYRLATELEIPKER